MKMKSFRRGIKDGIPIGLGYFAVSFAFGIQAVAGGLSPWQAALISLTNLTSAGQFRGLPIIVAGGSLLEMAFTQLIINLRYILMSFSLSQKLESGTSLLHRMGVAFGITDEIFAVSIGQPEKISPFYSYGAMSMAIPGWTLGTYLGAVAGNILPAIIVSALSVALYGMFLAVVVPASKKSNAVFGVVITAMIISSIFEYVPALQGITSGFVIIITTVLVAGIAAILCPVKEES